MTKIMPRILSVLFSVLLYQNARPNQYQPDDKNHQSNCTPIMGISKSYGVQQLSSSDSSFSSSALLFRGCGSPSISATPMDCRKFIITPVAFVPYYKMDDAAWPRALHVALTLTFSFRFCPYFSVGYGFCGISE